MSIRKIPAKPAALRSFQDPAVKQCKICSLLTRPLGLLGWETLESVLLAALTTRDPLLLIGKHGTGKSFLLERLAQALGLVYRFYNASLINYDDLVGIPVPDETRSSLRYITTPTAIWDAEVVFVDELNRTRPDLQNKLFPIIHERRVQGVELEKLRYRWAAMNPAANGEHDEQEAYLGTEPLDPALADRFGFLIEVPDWSDLSEAERTEVLLDQFRGPHEFPVQIADLVEESAAIFREFCARPPVQLCGYFVALESQLRAAGTRFSSRRMTTLFRISLGIQAARIALSNASGEKSLRSEWQESLFLALAHGHPGLASWSSGSCGATCFAPAGLEHRRVERGRSLEGPPKDRRSGGASSGCQQSRFPVGGSRSLERDPRGGSFATDRSAKGRDRAGALSCATLLQSDRRHSRRDTGRPTLARASSIHDHS